MTGLAASVKFKCLLSSSNCHDSATEALTDIEAKNNKNDLLKATRARLKFVQSPLIESNLWFRCKCALVRTFFISAGVVYKKTETKFHTVVMLNSDVGIWLQRNK